jgi:hypothetical protein
VHDVEPVVDEKVPDGQALHDELPILDWKLPDGQSIQIVSPRGFPFDFPLKHGIHIPVQFRSCPGGQHEEKNQSCDWQNAPFEIRQDGPLMHDWQVPVDWHHPQPPEESLN